MMDVNKIIQGDCRDVLKTLPDNSVDCTISSPPYWNLRNYNHENQIGLEPTFKDFVSELVDVYREIKRVLKPTGTCFVNLGDTYNANYRGGTSDNASSKQNSNKGTVDFMGKSGKSEKCLLMIPERFAIAMIDEGWVLRNQIIWYKRNAMPQSATDRFTVDFEKIFFFVKKPTGYYFEQQLEKSIWADLDSRSSKGKVLSNGKCETGEYAINGVAYREDGMKNMRTVWDIPTEATSDAHFATYPQTLVERMIKAGCPEEVCNKCGKPREKIFENGDVIKERNPEKGLRSQNENSLGQGGLRNGFKLHEKKLAGYTDCGCDAGFSPGIVLDPFSGAGTTALVAKKLGRNYLGIEINPEYIEISNKRLYNHLGLFKDL